MNLDEVTPAQAARWAVEMAERTVADWSMTSQAWLCGGDICFLSGLHSTCKPDQLAGAIAAARDGFTVSSVCEKGVHWVVVWWYTPPERNPSFCHCTREKPKPFLPLTLRYTSPTCTAPGGPKHPATTPNNVRSIFDLTLFDPPQ